MFRAFRTGLLVLCSLPLLAGGGFGLYLSSAGEKEVTEVQKRLGGWLADSGIPTRWAGGGEPEDRPASSKAQAKDAAERVVKFVTSRRKAAGLVGLGLFLIIVGIRGAVRPRSEDREEPRPRKAKVHVEGRPSKSNDRKVRKAAAAIEAEHGPRDAGEYLVAEGLCEDAARLFLRVGMFERAAELFHDQNRFRESAELYEKGGRLEAAAAIYAQIERTADSARCYLAANKRAAAAEMFEKAGDYLQAGRCYRDCGFYRHATDAFLRVGSQEDAADALVAVFNEEAAGVTSHINPQRQQELRDIAVKAGKLLVGLERLEEAENLLVRAGAWTEAAEVALVGGAYEQASDLYVRAGRADLAADALERAGEGKRAASLRGGYLREQGEYAPAAALLEEAEEWVEAADLYRRLEQYEKAAVCYERSIHPYDAAEMYRAAGEFESASRAYENAGQHKPAAECAAQAGDIPRSAELLERARDLYGAGQAYAEVGRPDDAIRLLQEIDPDDPHFSQAAMALGRLFRDKGMHSLSVKKFQQAIGDAPVSRQTVEAHYDVARAFEEIDDLPRAVEAYERILTFDYHYSDVAERLERAKQQVRTQGSRGRSGTAQKNTGRYRLIRELGRGGMGVVHLARDTVLDRDVAFKVLPEGVRASAASLRSFLREAKAAAKLNHPHIVTVYDAGKSEHGFFLAMEYVEGSTLKQIILRRGAIPPPGVVYVLRQMSDALAYAHSKKVVHRDIKTANTMWTPAKKIKIMDFGLAKILEEVRNQTTLVSGTPFYMSPEQTVGQSIDHRTDLYSLGVAMFELATAQVPFRTGNISYHHVHTPPPDPREINPKIPEFLARVILRCLEKDPEDRYGTAEEIIEELDRFARPQGS
jgi:tetratricopeptide (TPR) repeat protein